MVLLEILPKVKRVQSGPRQHNIIVVKESRLNLQEEMRDGEGDNYEDHYCLRLGGLPLKQILL